MVSAPFGLKTEYEDGWVGRYYAQTSELQIVDLTLSAALDVVPDRLSVGAGLIYSHADVTLSRAVDFGTLLFGAGVPAPFARPGSIRTRRGWRSSPAAGRRAPAVGQLRQRGEPLRRVGAVPVLSIPRRRAGA